MAMQDGIAEIIRKINADAEAHAAERYDEIKTDIDADVDKENHRYEEETRKRREGLVSHNNREYTRMLERINSRLNQEIIAYQNELTDEIFDAALQKLRGVARDEFTDMAINALAGLTGGFTIHLGELSDGKLDMESIERHALANGLTVALSVKHIPYKSGFLFRDNRVEYNCLFEDLIAEMKTEMSAEVLKEVFGY